MPNLGERIKNLREKRNLTQKDLSFKSKLTIVQISRYENNERKPDPEALSRIADVLDTTTDYLLGRTDNPFSDFADHLKHGSNAKKNIGIAESNDIYIAYRHGKRSIDVEDEEEEEFLRQQQEQFRAWKEKKRQEREQKDN